MATPNEKLAASLTALRKLQKGGRRVLQSQELSRPERIPAAWSGPLIATGTGNSFSLAWRQV
jgi:hypothetical protein